MPEYAFYINSSACSGCKTCQVACKDKNDLPTGVNWRRVYEIEGGGWKEENGVFVSQPYGYFLSLSCQNCENPECVKACPTTAMHVNASGIVAVDSELCIGCRYCSWACPYGAPQYDQAKKVMTKCNLCEDYLSIGTKPSCVMSCPMRALDFGTWEEITSKYGTGENVFPLPDPSQYKPGIVIKPHRNSAMTRNDKAYIAENEYK
ncbi:MAG TPA: dimethylsulfoxide reductase subunit B [Bacteroidales bacterium]|nr:dimethylsulfoxide reductase subunit B [Bacteroidales bacterium]HOM41588.1 dimethylsulfoxide reductase subunit B [Bacteroidales bacterium]HPP93592.1 dimethylsulfoxide reductase subunit B [Bacteroidales bacterium]